MAPKRRGRLYRDPFSADFSTFEARHNSTGGSDNWATGWSGVRKSEAQSRKYETLWGVMKCDFEGSQVACAYPWFNGKVLGQLKGRAFTGLWLQADGGGGNVRMTFAEDFSSFEGTYTDFNLPHLERVVGGNQGSSGRSR